MNRKRNIIIIIVGIVLLCVLCFSFAKHSDVKEKDMNTNTNTNKNTCDDSSDDITTEQKQPISNEEKDNHATETGDSTSEGEQNHNHEIIDGIVLPEDEW